MPDSRAVLLLVMALALGAEHASAQVEAQRAADSTWTALLASARSGDTTVDCGALRMAYAHDSAYTPISPARAALRERMLAAFAAREPNASMLVDSLLDLNFTDIQGNVVAAGLAFQRGDSANARFHAFMARRLFGSMDAAHRGGPPDVPIVIVTPEDEEAFGFVTRLDRTGHHTTAECGVRRCDAVVFRDLRTGRDTTVHFDMSLIARRAIGWQPRNP